MLCMHFSFISERIAKPSINFYHIYMTPFKTKIRYDNKYFSSWETDKKCQISKLIFIILQSCWRIVLIKSANVY